MDDQGRVLIHPMLRHKSGTGGDVLVIGGLTYLDIWNREKFEAMVVHPNDDDLRVVGEHGI